MINDPESMRLFQTGEFGLIRNIRGRCQDKTDSIITGIGDDTAVLRGSSKKILVTSDMLVEGVHFDLSFTTFFQLGYKSLAVSVSDILAMGGKPEHFLISIAIPANCLTNQIDELYSGILQLAKEFGISVIGGDTSASRDGLIINGTLIGYGRKIVTRAGARPGDLIYVNNTLGDSAMGLKLLMKRRKRVHKFTNLTPSLKLIKKHLMPEIIPLKSISNLTSMIDISDGLLIDLNHICDESNVGAVIYREKIPLSSELIDISRKEKTDPVQLALKGGEDYALLFTAPANSKVKGIKIGEITEKGRFIIDEEGKKKKFKPEGYEHFK